MLRHASKSLCAAPKNGCCGMLRHAAAAHAWLKLRSSSAQVHCAVWQQWGLQTRHHVQPRVLYLLISCRASGIEFWGGMHGARTTAPTDLHRCSQQPCPRLAVANAVANAVAVVLHRSKHAVCWILLQACVGQRQGLLKGKSIRFGSQRKRDSGEQVIAHVINGALVHWE